MSPSGLDPLCLTRSNGRPRSAQLPAPYLIVQAFACFYKLPHHSELVEVQEILNAKGISAGSDASKSCLLMEPANSLSYLGDQAKGNHCPFFCKVYVSCTRILHAGGLFVTNLFTAKQLPLQSVGPERASVRSFLGSPARWTHTRVSMSSAK